jgi:hypothetical protein
VNFEALGLASVPLRSSSFVYRLIWTTLKFVIIDWPNSSSVIPAFLQA